ncbi:P-loop containing nucleoside triphosphate hydrolase protein [Dactylonectria estremocensis]|uniref:P-loop containing nucleoside triphosphate hydrolase protein n=1 Tax=Dactylonectria estremocensis TaxID=1079267 RepID=A0A9P9E1W4_9HYPO|nr:P-loop containing nucleoside triphosphate hydrolase protein [Dactylonectria estremocensis]
MINKIAHPPFSDETPNHSKSSAVRYSHQQKYSGMQQQQPSADVVILIMGVTGVGKSTFISNFTGQDTGIGHDLTSFTMGVNIYSMERNGRRIHLVDTPGFNDTWRSDVDILKELSFIMSQVYRKGMRFGGIIYLHRISDNRVSGTTVKNFTLLEKICGSEAAQRVFLVTTMWDWVDTGKLEHDEAERRERRLGAMPNYWQTLCHHGSKMRRHRGTEASAFSIVDELIALNEMGGYLTQQIQRELVDENKSLIDTSVGKELWAEHQVNEGPSESGTRPETKPLAHKQDSSPLQDREDTHEIKFAQEDLDIDLENLIVRRQPEYAKVLSRVCQEQQQLAKDIEEGDKQVDLLSLEIKEFDDTLKEERRQWRQQRRELRRQELHERRRQQSVNRERQRIKAEEDDFTENCQALTQESEEKKTKKSQEMGKLRKRDVAKRNLRPFLTLLAGVGLAVAGGVTGIAPLLGAGFGLSLTAANDFRFSRKRIIKVIEDGRALPNAGQGAAGAGID